VQIAEYNGGRRKIVAHVGSARTEAELGILLERAREMLADPAQGAFDLGIEPAVPQARLVAPPAAPTLFDAERPDAAPAARPARVVSTDSRLLFLALDGIYDDLGFSALDDDVFRGLVLARVVEPTSILDTGRVLADLGRRAASDKTMRRTLARCAGRGYRDTIAELCFAHARASGDISLVLYDVTTLYFEAEHEDALRKVGYSKERRVDPQVVVGLLVDRNGFPLEVGCYEGDKAEKHTILPVIRQFQARHGIEAMVVVADAGMLSAANLADLDEAGLGFIVGSRVTKAPVDLESHFRWHGDAFTDGQVIDTLTPKKGKNKDNDPAVRAEPAWDREEHPKSWRAVWAFSARRFARDNRTLTAQENRARDVISGAKSARTPRFVKNADGRPRPGREGPRPREKTGRAERLRHQPSRVRDALGRGHQPVPRPVARGAVLPDEQDRPGGPAHVRPQARRDRGAPDHRVHRPGRRPRGAGPHRPGHPQRDPAAPSAALGGHRGQRRCADVPARHRP
jgi:hypothetical protein